MKLIEEKIKQIIREEVESFFEQSGLARKMKNVGSLSLEAFINVINILSQDFNIEPEDMLLAYMEIALDLKKNWSPKMWDNLTEEEKEIFLKTTYPKTLPDDSLSLLIKSFTNQNLAKVIFSDVQLAIEKTEDAKKEIKAGKYLGPEELGGEPKSPHWKEYLEEIIKEEIVNHLK